MLRRVTWHRINRNIVECKEKFPENKFPMLLVLIETLWNVKTDLYNVLDVLYGY